MIVRELVTKLGFNIETSKLARFDRDIGALKNNLDGVSRNLNRVADNMARVGRTLSLFVSLPLMGVGIVSITAAAKIEQVALSLEVMLGSAEKGRKMLKELFDFAKKTPFQIENIAPLSKQLLAMGIEADKMIDTLTVLGNAAAGLGVPLFRLAYNFGQVKSQSRLTGMELKDFTRAGVPLLEVSSEMIFGTREHVEQIRELTGQGKISFGLVEEAFQKMSAEGGRFHNLMKRMAEKTLIGVWSNFLDGVYLARAELGKIIVETFKLQERFTKLNIWLDNVVEGFKKLSGFMKKFIVFTGLFLILSGPLLIVLAAVAKSIFFLGSAMLLMKSVFLAGAAGAVTFNAAMFMLPAIILAVVAALTLLAEDISVWIADGDSLIGELLGPWQEWRDTMEGFLEGVGAAIYDLIHGRFAELIEKGKFLAKVFGFFFKDLFNFEEEAEKFRLEMERKPSGRRPVGEELSWPQKFALAAHAPGEFARAAGMANRPLGASFGGGGNPVTIATTVNVTTTGEGAIAGREIADVVEEVLDRKITETIATNQTP